MQSQVQSQVQSQNQMQSQSNMEIVMIEKNAYVTMECSICYKPVQKAFAKCSEPCSKVFHTTCFEKIIEQTEIAAAEEDVEADHKCCYCRRSIDVNRYALQDVARRLICLRRGGYYVNEALKQVKKELLNNDYDQDGPYHIYFSHSIYYEKKPKQAKRSAPKKITKQPRIHVKQNIGGRRK